MSKQKIVRFDWAMKHLLRNKANYDIVEGFLCALLDDNDLKVIEVLESEGNLDYENDKFNRVDVLVKDAKDRNIIIEIQNTRESDYLYRVLYGTSKNISQSIDIGDKYREINKVISVSILYFNLGIGDDYLYYGQTEFVGMNTDERIDKNSPKIKNLISKNVKYNQVEIFPEYYLIQVEKYKNVVSKAIDEWVFWFKNEEIKAGSKSKNIEKVEKKLNYLKMNDKQRKNYEHFMSKLVSENDMIETAEETGEKRGRKETENKLKPIIEQKDQVIEQKDQIIEQKDQVILNFAKHLKNSGQTTEQIQKTTGLSKVEVEKL